jgi:hypothetical protein
MQGDENRASSLCGLDSFRELPTQVRHLLWTVPCPHDASSSLPTVVHTLAKHGSGYERGAIGHSYVDLEYAERFALRSKVQRPACERPAAVGWHGRAIARWERCNRTSR